MKAKGRQLDEELKSIFLTVRIVNYYNNLPRVQGVSQFSIHHHLWLFYLYMLDPFDYRKIPTQEKRKKEQQVSRALSCKANLKLKFQQNHKANFVNRFLLPVKQLLNYMYFYFDLCKRNEKSSGISFFAM